MSSEKFDDPRKDRDDIIKKKKICIYNLIDFEIIFILGYIFFYLHLTTLIATDPHSAHLLPLVAHMAFCKW